MIILPLHIFLLLPQFSSQTSPSIPIHLYFPYLNSFSSQPPRIFANERRESFPKNSLRTYSHSLPPISKITANHIASLTQHSSSASKLCLSFLNLIPTLFLSCIGPRTWQDAIFVCSTSLNSSDFHRYKL